MGMSMHTKILLGAFLTISLLPLQARAHWCDDMWTSSYNIVVRPDTDTVTLSSGTGTMNISVQNNMGYLLPNFALTAKIGTTAVTATRQAGKISGTTLHPGEKAKYTLAVTGSAGSSVKIEDISFFVKFGNSGQAACYPSKGAQAVMVRKAADGSLYPTGTPAGLSTAADPGSANGGNCTGGVNQSRQLQYSAQADFIDVSAGLDKLMTYYCAGRGSWDTGSDANITPSPCPAGGAITCSKPATGTGAGTKFEYPRLWAAMELVARKSSLGATRLANLRLALQCGAGDANTSFAGFAMMMLGYLGDDPGARTFLTGKVGTTDLGTIAKAALLLFGTAADKTTYETDVKGGLTKGGFVAASCAAALGIVEADDADVTQYLVPLAKWTEPDTSDNGQGLYGSHLLALVAWDRRIWAAKAGDTGVVSFYESGTTTSTGGSPGTGGSTGSGGSTGTGGAPGTGGITVTGGGTVPASGGSAGTPTGGSIGTGGIIVTGGKTGTASGGSAGTPNGGSIGTGGNSVTGGRTVTASGGSAGTPTGGSIGTGGSTGTPSGGTTTGAGTGGNTGSGTGGSTGNGTGGSASGGTVAGTGGSSGDQSGSGGSPSSGTAGSGSAGGCGYAGRAPIPLGFLLASVGLVLALRRRRR